MNMVERISPSIGGGTGITIAGERGLCDPLGALFFPARRLLVVSDLHLEKGSSLACRGSFLPPYDTAVTLKRLRRVILRHQPQVVVSLGDSFHDAGGSDRLPARYRDELTALMTGRDWYWVAGNHDPAPPQGLPGRSVGELAFGNLVFRHEPTHGAEGEIAGHLHPGARIVRRGRSVRRACFAYDGIRLIMPAFGSLTGNLNVLDRAFAGLFRYEALTAYMLGRERVYPIASCMLRPA
ncbi:ligase-associated DNA damage response endonuclease PdeM [Chelativorans sp. Marseille-P2723]|uniref:ligase-associated DNA damage response endonuclease PdeM n=1 Tax=Chelativorans sp. Marseille-P2723 TaxID=2709133 RepID=UPI0015708909|nr:ligase-associated DNA damage response endonuclease PdeM [Chelativorans sp. Marseille-P2723]